MSETTKQPTDETKPKGFQQDGQRDGKGDKSLAEVYRFGQKEQRMIEEAARRLATGDDPGIAPERFLIGAARFALDNRLAPAKTIKQKFYQELSRR